MGIFLSATDKRPNPRILSHNLLESKLELRKKEIPRPSGRWFQIPLVDMVRF